MRRAGCGGPLPPRGACRRHASRRRGDSRGSCSAARDVTGSTRAAREHQAAIDVLVDRETGNTRPPIPRAAPMQPGLFDSRAVDASRERSDAADTLRAEHDSRIEALERSRTAAPHPVPRRGPDRVALSGITGSLASLDLLEALARSPGATGGLRSVLSRARESLGPASAARQVADLLVEPLMRALGVETSPAVDRPRTSLCNAVRPPAAPSRR